MSLDRIHFFFILAGLVVALGVFVALFFVSAPYGRHLRKGWGPAIPNLLGWIFMEAPSALVFAVIFITGNAPKNLILVLFFVLWELHYVHRAFIYPFTIRDQGKKMPVAVMLMGIFFNLGNAYANSYYLFNLSGGYPLSWLLDPRFLAGLVLFLAGYGLNRWSDLILRSLRKHGDTGYHIPYGGLFRWVSSPNYLGEIVEWCGWALATCSLPGLAFALWTIANLAPRARSNHQWYHEHFSEYPVDRKALIPWVW